MSLHASLTNEVHGVERHVVQRQLTDIHLLVEQRPQRHIGHHAARHQHRVAHLWKRIVGLQGLHLLQTQIERKGQAHIAHRYLHTRLLGSIGRRLPHRPVLEWWEIKQGCQQAKNNDGGGDRDGSPLDSFSHTRASCIKYFVSFLNLSFRHPGCVAKRLACAPERLESTYPMRP